MLVLSRKVGQKVILPEYGVEITVTAIRGNHVCLGITAPSAVRVHRQEVWQRIRTEMDGEQMAPQVADGNGSPRIANFSGGTP